LAKNAAPSQKVNQSKTLIPVSTDPRSELYFLLGRLPDIESADRITVLVTQLTNPAPAETGGE
jgi:hypothetical protein